MTLKKHERSKKLLSPKWTIFYCICIPNKLYVVKNKTNRIFEIDGMPFFLNSYPFLCRSGCSRNTLGVVMGIARRICLMYILILICRGRYTHEYAVKILLVALILIIKVILVSIPLHSFDGPEGGRAKPFRSAPLLPFTHFHFDKSYPTRSTSAGALPATSPAHKQGPRAREPILLSGSDNFIMKSPPYRMFSAIFGNCRTSC